MFLTKKVSSFMALLLIFFCSLIVGSVVIWKSTKLAELQKPLPFIITNY